MSKGGQQILKLFCTTPQTCIVIQAVANLAQSTSASQSPQPPVTPSVPVGAALQVGLSEEEALELAIQESQKVGNIYHHRYGDTWCLPQLSQMISDGK